MFFKKNIYFGSTRVMCIVLLSLIISYFFRIYKLLHLGNNFQIGRILYIYC